MCGLFCRTTLMKKWFVASTKPTSNIFIFSNKKKQSVCDAECIVLWAWNDKVLPALQYQYSYLTCMSLYTVLYSLLFFICLFSCFVSIVCILCFLYCLSFVYSWLVPIFVQVYWPLPPGGNPIAVNKYHIISYIIPYITSHHITSRHVIYNIASYHQ